MKRILVADDEDILRMLISDTLEDEGYEIEEAADGEEAFKAFLQQPFDLLILDYMMPGKTGLEVIKQVRQQQKNKGVKILMLTAKSQQQDELEVIGAGADYFLAKPFSPLKLMELVGEILHD